MRVRCRQQEPLGKVTGKCTPSCVQGAKLKRVSEAAAMCQGQGAGGGLREPERREGHLPIQDSSLTSFCWNPAELGTGVGFPLPPAAGKEQARRHTSLRAAESILASAAPTALVIPCHAERWHSRTAGSSLPTARTAQMATNPWERKPNTRLICGETPNSKFNSQRQCGMGTGFAKQTSCSEGFCRRL